MTKRRRFYMTQDDVEQGGNHCTDCAVACCVRRTLGLALGEVTVDRTAIWIKGYWHKTPVRVARFIDRYDKVRQVKDRPAPINFYLTLEDATT